MAARGLCVAVAIACLSGRLWAQQEAPQDQPPPEVQRLIDLMQSPEKVRGLMQEPAKILEVMQSLESPKVQEYLRDPQHVAELMSKVDLLKVQEAMREIDPARVREAMFLGLKIKLEAGDEEWKVLGPKIAAVVQAQEEMQVRPAGRPGGPRVMGVSPFGGADAEPSEMAKAAERLRAVARDPKSSPDEITRRLVGYRDTRDAARRKLEAAQRDLLEVLTVRQEGVLTMLGILN
jgi:hypothetical protein